MVYWFKNARAAYKRRRIQGSALPAICGTASSPDKGLNSPGSIRDQDNESDREASVSPPPSINQKYGESHSSQPLVPQHSTPLLDKWKEYEYQRRLLAEAQQRLGWHQLAAAMQAQQHAHQAAQQTLDLSVKSSNKVQSCSSEADNDSGDSSKEGHTRNDSDPASDDDEMQDQEAWENRMVNAQTSNQLAMYGAYNGAVAIPGVPPPFQANLLNTPHSLENSSRKRNRTFIDPVSEVPKLEKWFNEVTTHPHHAQIEEFTAELNSMEYRQKFPKLEPRNVQFWFKNRRAKYKRIEKSAASVAPSSVSPSVETTVSS